MPTYSFTGPQVKAIRTGTCSSCGVPATRARTFNKRPDGFSFYGGAFT